MIYDLPMPARSVPGGSNVWIGENVKEHAAGEKKSRKALILKDNPLKISSKIYID